MDVFQQLPFPLYQIRIFKSETGNNLNFTPILGQNFE